MVSNPKYNVKCFIIFLTILISPIFVNGAEEADKSTSVPEISAFSLDPSNTGMLQNSVNLYTGDVNLPLNLVALSGKNGLNVNVSIVYNSNIQKSIDTWNLEAPTSILGLGWSLSFDQIIVDHKNTGSYHDNDYYLVSGGVNTLLDRTGSGNDAIGGDYREYKCQNYQFWLIKYYYGSEKWIITKEDGKQYIFGGTTDSKQLGVKWDNWIGASVNTTDQENFIIAWNQSEIVDLLGNSIKYTYENTTRQVGSGGLYHTEASYLKEIEDVFGRTVTFTYGDKTKDVEYVEPHQEVSESSGFHEPDAYQERYETKYLNYIEIKTSSESLLKKIEFEYFSPHLVNDGNKTKRGLKAIYQKNPCSEYIPPVKFEYYGSGDTHPYALKKVILPSGGSVQYTYNTQSITSHSLRKLSVPRPAVGWGYPKYFMHEDYIIVTWYDEPNLRIYAYTWEGEWLEKYLGQIADVGHGSDENFQKFKIVTEKDFIAFIRKPDNNTELKLLKLWTRDYTKRGEWCAENDKYLDMCSGSDEGEAYITSGDNFVVVVCKERGKMYRYQWDGVEWTGYSRVTDIDTDDSKDFAVKGTNNYFIYQNTNTNTDSLYFFYLKEDGNWEKSIFNYTFNSPGSGSARAYLAVNNNFATMQAEINDPYDIYMNLIYTWGESFDTYPPEIFVPDNRDGIFQPVESLVSLSSSYLAKAYAWNGDGWISQVFSRDQTSSHVGNNFVIRRNDEPNGYIKRWVYDPNNSSWSYTLHSNIDNPDANVGYNSYVYWDEDNDIAKIYYRQPNSSWNETSLDNWNSGDYDKDLRIGNGFYVFRNWSSSSYLGVNIGFIENGTWESNNSTLDAQNYLINVYGNNILLANNDQSSQMSNLMLIRFVDDNTLNTQIDYYVDNIKSDYGYSGQETYTYYKYDSGTATFDQVGLTAQYNKVTVYPQQRSTSYPYGATEHYYFNGLPDSDPLVDLPDDVAYICNTSDYYNCLKGSEYKIKVLGTGSEPPTLSETVNYWYVYEKELTSDLGTYARICKTENTLDGITTVSTTSYNNKGLPEEQIVTNTDGTQRKTATKYAYEETVYSDMLSKNMLTPVIQTTVKEDNTPVSSSLISYDDDWDSGCSAWMPKNTYVWLDDGDNTIPSITNWQSPPSEYQIQSSIRDIDDNGNVLETQDVNNVVTTSVWGYDDQINVATITNAEENEVFIDDFNIYTSNTDPDYTSTWSGFTSSTSFEDDGMLKFNNETGTKWGYLDHILSTSLYDVVLECDVIPSVTTDKFYVAFRYGSSTYVATMRFGSEGYIEAYNNTTFAVLDLYEANKKYHVKLEVHSSNDIWYLTVNGKNYGPFGCTTNYPANRIRFYDKYDPGYGKIENVRCYPTDAFCTSSSYDPGTLQLLESQDVNGVSTHYHYDDSYNLISTSNNGMDCIGSSYQFYSRDLNSTDIFHTDDPNYVRTVSAQTDGIIDDFNYFKHLDWVEGLGSWGISNDKYRQSDYSVALTNTISSTPFEQTGPHYYRWKVTFNQGSCMAGIHVLASSGSSSNRGNSYLFWQSENRFTIYESINNSLSICAQTDYGDFGASNEKIYVYEAFVNNETGWIDVWRDGIHVISGFDNTPVNTGSYISLRTNKSDVSFDDIVAHGSPIISIQFADGLGRGFQIQACDDSYNIISKAGFDVLGRKDKSYYPEYQLNYGYEYKAVSPTLYTQTVYEDNPLSRTEEEKVPIAGGGMETIKIYTYGTSPVDSFETSDNNTYHISTVTQKISSNKSIRNRIYTDKFGNQVASKTTDGSNDHIYWYKISDILGQVEEVRPPNYYKSTDGGTGWESEFTFNTLGQVKQDDNPDEGITKYVYDDAGNVRYKQNAEQRLSGNFTVFEYDNMNRISSIAEEKTGSASNYNWSSVASAPDISGNYGTDTGEWRIKYTYDTNFISVSSIVNYCKGQLTQTEINDDSDDVTEHKTQYAYDEDGNIILKRISIDNSPWYTIKHVYDAQGKEIETVYPSGHTVVRAYNNLGQLYKIFKTWNE